MLEIDGWSCDTLPSSCVQSDVFRAAMARAFSVYCCQSWPVGVRGISSAMCFMLAGLCIQNDFTLVHLTLTRLVNTSVLLFSYIAIYLRIVYGVANSCAQVLKAH